MDFVVDKKRLEKTCTIPSSPLILRDGDILIQIVKFSFTANNISYAATGDALKYWEFFPLKNNDHEEEDIDQEKRGRIPVWGIGIVVASRLSKVDTANSINNVVGRRVYGYFPMSQYVVLHPIHVTNGDFIDGMLHRRSLPAVYNQYLFTDEDPFYTPRTEDAMITLRPLFFTSWLLLDFFTHPTSYDAVNGKPFFGSTTILISSASSKTSIGLAFVLFQYNQKTNQQTKSNNNNNHTIAPIRIVGLTSSKNSGMVRSLQIYDCVIEYDNLETQLDTSQPTCFVDMAGNTNLTTKLHERFQDNLKYTCLVGAAHVGKGGKPTQPLKGARRPKFFFAPSWTAQRIRELGGGGGGGGGDGSSSSNNSASSSSAAAAIDRRRGLKILLHHVLLDYQLFVNWCLGTINENLEEGKGKQWLHMKRYYNWGGSGDEEEQTIREGYMECLQGKIQPDTAVIMSLWPKPNPEEEGTASHPSGSPVTMSRL